MAIFINCRWIKVVIYSETIKPFLDHLFRDIAIGMLCDESGAPVSTEVFRGNTQERPLSLR